MTMSRLLYELTRWTNIGVLHLGGLAAHPTAQGDDPARLIDDRGLLEAGLQHLAVFAADRGGEQIVGGASSVTLLKVR